MKISLFDLDFILYLATYPDKKLLADGVSFELNELEKPVLYPKTLERVYQSADEIIDVCLRATKAEGYVMYLGGKDNFRYKIYPGYKAKRGTEKPQFFDELKQYLQDTWRAILVDGCEADDAVSIAKQILLGLGQECTIISPDKDVLMLPGVHYNPKKNEFITTPEVVSYEKRMKQLITGDSTDGVSGVEKAGEVFADKLFNGMPPNTYAGLVFDCYIRKYGLYQGVLKFYQNFRALWIIDNEDDLKDFAVFKTPIVIAVDKTVIENKITPFD